MISLGRRDAREEVVGLGFGSEREMEDTELEEGEACSYHNNNDDDFDASMDPDIDLSYIDEKLQDVLGHFQKDFEGGVSAENLGAKFGGYGSFLPTYQRSPVWSHPRTTLQKIQHCSAARSPNNFQLEGGLHSSVSSSTASQLTRIEASTSLKTSYVLNELAKQEARVPSIHSTEELVPRDESLNRKSASLPDQKMLKVRIKVGSDNLSTQKNAAIYSGLGLDVSPSSSLDDSPSESEGMSREPQDAQLESPAHILQIMTSFPAHGDVLLSPLPDDLLHLKEKEKLLKDSGFLPVPKFGPERSCNVVNGSSSANGAGATLGEKKIKSIARNEISPESKSDHNKDSGGGLGIISKEIELGFFACEEPVSNALKLPLLSNSYSAAVGSSKGMSEESIVSKGALIDKDFSGLTKEELMVPVFTQENGSIKNSKCKAFGKVWEDRKAGALRSDSVSPTKDGHRRGEEPYDTVKINPGISKGRKALDQASADPSKQNADETCTSHEQEVMKFPNVKGPSSEGKKKLKGSQSHGNAVVEAPDDGLRSGSSLAPKNKKSSHADKYTTKWESEDLKLQKISVKAGDRYREFFGDIELEQEENRTSTSVKSFEDRLKDSERVEKSTNVTNSMPKDKSSSKKLDKLLTSEAFPKAASLGAVPHGDGLNADAASGDDNWVCCDKCQKWRLLPARTNPDDLPEKWLCSMLDWLPGMNRCSFSEDETTHATRSLKQNNPVWDLSKLTLADARDPDQNHQNFGSHAVIPGGRKKQGLKEFPNIVYKEVGPTLSSNSTKKSLQVSVTNGSLNDVKPAPVGSDPASLKGSKSSYSAVEKHKQKPRDKHAVLAKCSDRGGSKRSKMKGKRDHDQDYFGACKKIRTDDLAQDWMSDHGGAIEKVGPISSSGLTATSSVKNMPKYNDCSSHKNLKIDQKDRAQLSAKKPKHDARALDNGFVDTGKCDDGDTKKRKMKESHDTEIHPSSFQDTGHNPPNSAISEKELSESNYRKDKKARVSRSDGREASGSKGNSRTDKKGSHRKNQQLGHDLGSNLSQRSLDGVDFLKRDSGSIHLADTSSSSKVSGSHKTKANFHDAKGSPVESVSSSPVRLSKMDKLVSARKNVTKKMDSGLRRFSDGEEDGGSNRSGTARKEKNLVQIVPSPDIANGHHTNTGADFFVHDSSYCTELTALDQCHGDEKQNENRNHVNGSHPRKSGKGSSLLLKNKNRYFNSEFENEIKISDSVNVQAPSYEVKLTDCKDKTEEKYSIKSEENENRYVDKVSSVEVEQALSDNSKRENRLNVGGPHGLDVKVDAICNHDTALIPKESVLIDSGKVSDRGKSQSMPPSRGAQNETRAGCPDPNTRPPQGNGANILAANGSDGDGETNMLRQIGRVDHPNGIHHHHNSSRKAASNGHRVRDFDAPSPVKRDSSSQAATNALKEAKNLKHMADRVKNSGSNLESTRLYFEAALKFLHGASLLETCSSENAKNGEINQSMQVYRSTAKLCEFCAHEYEKSKDMAAAALAYKCMEVAYMRVIYSSHTSANRDRHELQMSLQIIPPGESPSSSASDIDNLNHTTVVEKGLLTKGVTSPQVTGSHIIAARNRPNFLRLLKFAQDVNFAMEASRKSCLAFEAANISLGETRCGEGFSSIKTALDFNFQDVEGLLRLVRLAIEAISR